MPKWKRYTVTTKGYDPELAYIGGPDPNNQQGVGLIVPNVGTLTRPYRWHFALATAVCGPNERMRIVGFSQLLTIATRLPTADQGVTILRECQVTTPTWHFPDGDVLWYFRLVPLTFNPVQRVYAQPDGVITSPDPTMPGRLEFNLRPLNNGVPIGKPIQELPSLRAIVNPYGYSPRGPDIKVEIPSGSRVIVYASVWQPENVRLTRIRPTGDPTDEALLPDNGFCPEDRFWLSFADSQYYRIGCELKVETKPICGQECSGPDGG